MTIFHKNNSKSTSTTTATNTTDQNQSFIYENVIGKNHSLVGPFFKTPMVYADSTASGKSLAFIEDYIRSNILPFYANTHTEASLTGLQTSKYREEARDYIRDALNAPKEDYAILFAGSGVTGAVDKLRGVLGISTLSPKIREGSNKRPVVFIGPYEHHSNELPWRESQCDVIVIPEHPKTGSIDIQVLAKELRKYADRPIKIGSFSAASNVTGIRSDTKNITKVLRMYGALSFWDFAAAGSHTGIDMKGEDYDAVFLSVHKYVGGPGTPGVLAARRSLFKNNIPSVPGGGTIKWVDVDEHKYLDLDNIEEREEGGTPAIVDSIRAGLVLRTHQNFGPDKIEMIEQKYLKKAFDVWKKNPNIIIMGNDHPENRVSIVSFMIRSPQQNKVLHHNYVVSLLNDLFGLQTRGGCACAGPYMERLLKAEDLKAILYKDYKSVDYDSSIKPGWVRLGFSYYMLEETVDFIINAVDLVAREGYRLLPWYKYKPETSTWKFCGRNADQKKALDLWDPLLGEYSPNVGKDNNKKSLDFYYKQAHDLLLSVDPQKGPKKLSTNFPEDMQHLRWFSLPEEIRQLQEQSNLTKKIFGRRQPPHKNNASRHTNPRNKRGLKSKLTRKNRLGRRKTQVMPAEDSLTNSEFITKLSLEEVPTPKTSSSESSTFTFPPKTSPESSTFTFPPNTSDTESTVDESLSESFRRPSVGLNSYESFRRSSNGIIALRISRDASGIYSQSDVVSGIYSQQERKSHQLEP